LMIAIAAAIYLAVCRALRMEELTRLTDAFVRRFKR
jgi:hypothetical protein